MLRPLIVGVAGGSASGKTSVCHELYKRIGLTDCTVLAQDNFYKECTDEEFENIGNYNFDHPDAFDWDLLRIVIQKLQKKKDVLIPKYNYSTCKRDEPGIYVKCTDLILIEGIFVLYMKDIRNMFDLKIFVDTDADIRLMRRIKRDIVERNRDLVGVLKSYNKFVRPAYIDFIKPTMRYSDLIVPQGIGNEIAISFIAENMKNKLLERGFMIFDEGGASNSSASNSL